MTRVRSFIPVLMIIPALLACGLLPASAVPTTDVADIVAATLQALTGLPPQPATAQSQPGGIEVSFPEGGFVIPSGLASGAAAEAVPEVADPQAGPGWELAPAHVRISLQGYTLQGKFHEPQIVIYPADTYAALNDGAAQNIQRLRDVLSSPAAPISSDALPSVPFFNAAPVFHAQTAVIPFKGGEGIRVLTEYAQYTAPVNNVDLFYHFQGLTSDGKTYIVAILPITAPLLAPSSDPSSVPPIGGIPFPGYENADPAAIESYYAAVSNLLDSMPAGDFDPSLTALDALIGSLSVSP